MTRLILRRLAWCAIQLLLLSFLVFVLSEFMPGDALTGRISPNITGAQMAEMRQKMGLDQPWNVRYADWLKGIAHGDFGVSYSHKLPVTRLAGEKFVNTLFLGCVTLVFCYGLAIPLGAIAGRWDARWPDKLVSTGSYVMMSTPQAVFGVLSIFVFAYTLKWFPAGGSIAADVVGKGWAAEALSRLYHAIMPAFTAAILTLPMLIQLLRAEVINNKSGEFVTALRGRGLTERRIFTAHILRNSALPVAAVSGSLVAMVFSGTVLVESVFSYPGMGKLFLDSVLKRDYPVANFLIIVFAAIAVAGTLLSDLLMHRLDPRVKMR